MRRAARRATGGEFVPRCAMAVAGCTVIVVSKCLALQRLHDLMRRQAVSWSHHCTASATVSLEVRRHPLIADAQAAVLWAVTHAKTLGADPNRLYLSGHSAGGNIAELLAVGPWLAPPTLPVGAVKGVIGISDVYTLVRPLGGPFSCSRTI